MGKFSVFVLRHQVPFADMQEGVRSDEAQRKTSAFVRLCTVPSLRKSERQYTQSFCVNIHINKEARVCVSMRACVGGRERR